MGWSDPLTFLHLLLLQHLSDVREARHKEW